MSGWYTEAQIAVDEARDLHVRGKFDEATQAWQRILGTDPRNADAWYGLGHAAKAQGEYGAAIAALDRALALRPASLAIRGDRAEVLFNLGEMDRAIAEYESLACSGDDTARGIALANIAVLAPGDPTLANADILRVRRRWMEAMGEGVRPVAPAPPPPAGRRLRIGYLSGFFGSRNWMMFVWGVINRHDRSKYEIVLLSDGRDPSAESGYVDHADDQVWQIANASNAEMAGHVARAGIDVLVNVDGYSTQRRLPLFLYRPARLQVAWMGMYGTTGSDRFDWVVGDANAIPPEDERFCAEKVTRVPGSYLAFEVNYPAPAIAPPPCLEAGFLTFGCLGSAYKITDQMVRDLSAILAGAPQARLLLRNRALDAGSNREAMRARFLAAGLPPDRVTLEGGGDHHDFLMTYGRIDIALDTYPYNGGTTTAEAIWQGVPLLTFNGDRWASRTSRSILVAAGLGEWVARDNDSYVATAIALARDPATPGRLAALRTVMRAQVAASPACDVGLLCRSLEALYETARTAA